MLKYICLLVTAACCVKGICPRGCKYPLAVYEELGCTPFYEKPSDCCPNKYDCSQWFKDSLNHCAYRGKRYRNLEKTPRDESCSSNCTCLEMHGFNFDCPPLECPEYHFNAIHPDCYHEYELGKCCSKGQVCTRNREINCTVGSRTYVGGQRFSPDQDKCVECVCQKGFNGKFVEPFCRKINCGIELMSAGEVRNYYAPVYKMYNKCCPTWLIPRGNEIIVQGSKPMKRNGLKCRFGKQLLSVGDTFVVRENNREAKCECRIPPLVTCITTKKTTQKP